ncbi:hypothetical protein [Psychrobacter lutiphocae]|uniref:hypothetical protein n=1 Tax=Psychrobacter lutiphocae TaxID=540500 RepID=UPI000367D4C2|nr:hypothetical protein [Psychrobacter lutiphocae]
MTTLFQLHANINNLKALIKELGTLWKPGDSILLLGETCAYYSWAKAYIDDINHDDESEYQIANIKGWYVLSEDINALNDSAKINLDLTGITALTDADWVQLTQDVERVVTLDSTT